MDKDNPAAFPFTTEHKVSHREWDEAVFSADDFIACRHHLLAAAIDFGLADADDDLSYVISNPTFAFENGTIHVDDMWGFSDEGGVYTSSHQSGVCEWNADDGAYIKQYYGQPRNLGELVTVRFTLTDKLSEMLAARKATQ